jgi:hypothetical protein
MHTKTNALWARIQQRRELGSEADVRGANVAQVVKGKGNTNGELHGRAALLVMKFAEVWLDMESGIQRHSLHVHAKQRATKGNIRLCEEICRHVHLSVRV